MEIYKIDEQNSHFVSHFMANIKSEWWDVEGAKNQLNSGVGWYFGSTTDQPKGWVLCKSLSVYKTGEIECLGYDEFGAFKIGKELQPLIEESEKWARSEGFTIMRFTITSRGLSCHQRALGEPWRELRDIHVIDREEYDWFLSMGYMPSGVLPNIYGENYHGILLVKQL